MPISLPVCEPKAMPGLVPPEPPLTDDVVLLRLPTLADVDAYRAVRSESDTRYWMGWDDDRRPSREETAATIERALGGWHEGTWAVFVIVDAPNDAVVGGANLRLGDFDSAEVSYYLAAAARGRGYATRTVLLLARWAFDRLGIQRLELRAHPDNEASIRVAERAGFTREGIERASRAWPNGTRFDSVLFSLLPADLL
jgi:RimJ/RimL family protein N-acetyltransferase